MSKRIGLNRFSGQWTEDEEEVGRGPTLWSKQKSRTKAHG